MTGSWALILFSQNYFTVSLSSYDGASITQDSCREGRRSSSVNSRFTSSHAICSCSLRKKIFHLHFISPLIEDLLKSSCTFENNGCSLLTSSARIDLSLGLKVCGVGSANSLQRTRAFQSWASELSNVHFSLFSETITLHYPWTNERPSDFLAKVLPLSWKLEQECVDSGETAVFVDFIILREAQSWPWPSNDNWKVFVFLYSLLSVSSFFSLSASLCIIIHFYFNQCKRQRI